MRNYLYQITILILVISIEAHGDDDFSFERIEPESLNKHPYYTQVTTVSGEATFIYVAGQTDRAIDYTVGSNECRHDDWRGQIMGVRENVGKALEAAGANWDDVVFTRLFVVDMAEYLKVLVNRETPLPSLWKSRRPPPGTLIEINKLSEPCQLLEIDVFAAVAADDDH